MSSVSVAANPPSRFTIPRERTHWAVPLAIAAALHLALVLAGTLSRHDTLLDLIARGGIEAVGPSDPQPAVEAEVELVDLEPPPEENPDFVVPQEVKPEPEEIPPPPPEIAQTAPPEAVIPPPPLPVPPAPVPEPAPPTPPSPVVAEADPAPQPAPSSGTAPVQEAFAPSEVVIGNRDFPKPPYPYEAKLRHLQGTVVVSLSVVDGRIVDAAVERSSGSGLLDRTAVTWIRKKWRFPAEVTRSLTQPIAFELSAGV